MSEQRARCGAGSNENGASEGAPFLS